MARRVQGGRGELAARIAQALRELGFFIGQSSVDNPHEVAALLRSTGLDAVLPLEFIDRGHEFYIVEPNTRPCRVECSTRCRRDHSCMETCIAECRAKLVERAVEVLSRAARG